MKKYKVSQFMVCEAIYEVEADDPIEAAYKVLYEGDIQDPRFDLEKLSPALEIGMPDEDLKPFLTKENEHLFNSIRDDNEFISSINYVEELNNS